MSLTTENIDKIAHLARLGLSGDDRTRYTDSLNSILGLIDDLQAVNTQGIASNSFFTLSITACPNLDK